MKIIITGGAGFIGSNAANRYLRANHEVVILDDLSRAGTDKNLDWLRANGSFEFIKLDIRDAEGVARVFHQHRNANRVLHLAAQVAVTTSVIDPRTDFEINALGTLNVLEGMRAAAMDAPIIYSSTNKVYGEMTDVEIVERAGHYQYASQPFGISEERPLDFHSPYGCSKGAADQYVRDYSRIYGLRTIVFRQSCIYGYRQFGAEDQGWLAWFMIASQLGRPITVYGDGKQIRDVLFIDDLLDGYDAAFAKSETVVGRAYNIGGGPGNVLSLLDLLSFIEHRRGAPLKHAVSEWRPGDQKAFVSDIRGAQRDLDWSPKINSAKGMELLYEWVANNLGLFDAKMSPSLPRVDASSAAHIV